MPLTVDNTISQVPAQTLAELGIRIVELEPGAAFLAPVSLDELKQIATAGAEGLEVKTLDALVAWVDQHREAISSLYPDQMPPFDHLAGYWENFYRGPVLAAEPVRPSPVLETTRILDFDVEIPFGVPACAVTPHSGYINHFSAKGYDLLTYKTVRGVPWNPHPSPNLGFVGDLARPLAERQIDNPIEASLSPDALEASRTASFVNSIGVPSLSPHQWMADVDRSRQGLGANKVLMVSVMGTPEELQPGEDSRLVDQFSQVAGFAKEAGADIIELNLSCPNTGGDLLCRNPELSSKIVKDVRKTVGDTPIFIKISFLVPDELESLIRACEHDINGVVAINAVQVHAVKSASPFFRGRHNDLAGLSGLGIRDLGLATTRRLSALRGDDGATPADWVIVGIGGVMSAVDYQAYRDEGANAVQSCTGAWLNPNLATEVRDHAAGRANGDHIVESGSPASSTEKPQAWEEDTQGHPWRKLLSTVDAVRTGGLSLREPVPVASDKEKGDEPADR